MARAAAASRTLPQKDPAAKAANRISIATVSGRIAMDACLGSSNE